MEKTISIPGFAMSSSYTKPVGSAQLATHRGGTEDRDSINRDGLSIAIWFRMLAGGTLCHRRAMNRRDQGKNQSKNERNRLSPNIRQARISHRSRLAGKLVDGTMVEGVSRAL